jgi:hypothetical protein
VYCAHGVERHDMTCARRRWSRREPTPGHSQ